MTPVRLNSIPASFELHHEGKKYSLSREELDASIKGAVETGEFTIVDEDDREAIVRISFQGDVFHITYTQFILLGLDFDRAKKLYLGGL